MWHLQGFMGLWHITSVQNKGKLLHFLPFFFNSSCLRNWHFLGTKLMAFLPPFYDSHMSWFTRYKKKILFLSWKNSVMKTEKWRLSFFYRFFKRNFLALLLFFCWLLAISHLVNLHLKKQKRLLKRLKRTKTNMLNKIFKSVYDFEVAKNRFLNF